MSSAGNSKPFAYQRASVQATNISLALRRLAPRLRSGKRPNLLVGKPRWYVAGDADVQMFVWPTSGVTPSFESAYSNSSINRAG